MGLETAETMGVHKISYIHVIYIKKNVRLKQRSFASKAIELNTTCDRKRNVNTNILQETF